jgi:hypothetical protein
MDPHRISVVMEALRSAHGGVEIWDCPEIIVESGKQVQIPTPAFVGKNPDAANGTIAEPPAQGPEMDLVARIADDGESVDLTIIPMLTVPPQGGGINVAVSATNLHGNTLVTQSFSYRQVVAAGATNYSIASTNATGQTIAFSPSNLHFRLPQPGYSAPVHSGDTLFYTELNSDGLVRLVSDERRPTMAQTDRNPADLRADASNKESPPRLINASAPKTNDLIVLISPTVISAEKGR